MNKLIEIALSQYGITEIPGEEHNPEILKYFSEIGHKWVKTDETAWCSAFMNWCSMKANLPRSGKLNARSWQQIGTKVTFPLVGDIVIFWRESYDSWKGHVGIYINSNDKFIFTLGGNQNNCVCIMPYPKQRLLEYRRTDRRIK